MNATFLLLLLAGITVKFAFTLRRIVRGRAQRRGQSTVDLRLRALRAPAAEEAPDAAPGEPFAVLMDLARPQGTATLFATSAGDGSIYLSNGGGLLGGIGHENVRNAARAFVAESRKHLPRMTATTDTAYPAPGLVRFWVRTPEAVYADERPVDALAGGADPLSPLFFAGNEVITQLRMVAPEFGRG
jgi:hypothetical protein